ncbi:NAD-dependent epimerase/dehydratase family protein [Hydrogenovibrio halophilus]|uniref:NAD-dependent epimerase/dehydratase family protein n=1 Tax=Hydrogenovibrio halophilus TaxID=373391 RepID=UPI00035D0977|nr:NAD-dependent epimerase/dehydratase family protein [Hydrogenovibrio halophilus]
MRVLITGAGGFTGQHLMPHLTNAGHQVSGLTRTHRPTQPSLHACDLTDAETTRAIIQDLQPQAVIHLAGRAFAAEADTLGYYRHNVIATENLLNALTLIPRPKRVLLASSATVYGHQGLAQLSETLCPKPAGHYGISKLAMEQLGASHQSRLPIVFTRPFNYTGPGQAEHFLIPKMVAHFQTHQSEIALGNTQVAREFNDIRDVCRWYQALLEAPALPHTHYNLASGNAIQLHDIIEHLNALSGYRIRIQTDPALQRKNDLPVLTGDPSRLETLIDAPLTQHRIHDTLKWMLNQTETT